MSENILKKVVEQIVDNLSDDLELEELINTSFRWVAVSVAVILTGLSGLFFLTVSQGDFMVFSSLTILGVGGLFIGGTRYLESLFEMRLRLRAKKAVYGEMPPFEEYEVERFITNAVELGETKISGALAIYTVLENMDPKMASEWQACYVAAVKSGEAPLSSYMKRLHELEATHYWQRMYRIEEAIDKQQKKLSQYGISISSPNTIVEYNTENEDVAFHKKSA